MAVGESGEETMIVIAWVLMGILIGLAIWAAYGIGRDHGATDSNVRWRAYNAAWPSDASRRLFRLTRDVSFWQGKFQIVKHENNQLRRNLTTRAANGTRKERGR